MQTGRYLAEHLLPLLLAVAVLTVGRTCSARTGQIRVRRQTVDGAQQCVSEDGLDGICTALRDCQPLDQLLQLLKRGRASREQAQLLNRETHKCHFRNPKNPLVCCSIEALLLPLELTTPSAPREESTPPVTSAPVTSAPVTSAPVTSSPVTKPALSRLQMLPSDSICGIKSIVSRIVGGQKAEIGSWPWVVSIGYRERGDREIRWMCGAALITSHHILTAAHCVTQLGSGTEPVMVRLGELNFDTDPDCSPSDEAHCADSFRDIRIDSIHVHEEYKGRLGNAFEHDIAVVRLARSAEPFTAYVLPICLPLDLSRLAKGADDKTGNRAYITGWGRSEEFSFSDFTPELQEAVINIVPREKCEKTYNRSLTAGLGRRLCAGEGGGVDTCRGDSGGPLMTHNTFGTQWYLTGVTSFGSQTCGIREAVYTRVHDYIDWIVSKL